MPNILDVFNGDGFSVLEMTEAINVVPNSYDRFSSLGLFTPRAITTTVAGIEMNNGVLNLISSKKRGETGHKNVRSARNMRYFSVPHLPLEDRILPSDIQGVRAFGTADVLETVESKVNEILAQLSKKHDITHEYLKAGAIKGQVLDADGSTILDLFTEFGVTEKTVDFALANANTDIHAKCREVRGHMEDNLKGDRMTGVRAECSPEFFAKFVSHPKVQEAYRYYQSTRDGGRTPVRDDVSSGFMFCDIEWVEYRGSATYLQEDGTTATRKFIAANTVRFYPVGTTETFVQFNAPADWMETVNTPGLPKYAKVVADTHGRFVDILSESNPLPICMRPALLIKGGIASGDL